MPQTDQIYSYLSQIFWLVASMAALYLFLRNVALPRVAAVLEARQGKIQGDLERAGALKADAEKILAQYQAAVAEGRDKAQAVLRRTADEAQSKAAAAQDALGQRLAREIKAAEDRIGAAREAALANIQSVSAELARAAVDRLIGAKVDAAAASAAVAAAMRERA
jgi:F-type H+-transporting ATPase subunit b